ncbi:stage III sporulation protein AF [Robertmurraya siralis]|uniref:Stage III sporulation protein AF n=1 Tax=Robertmurraya siralis TaxID=77777 RepID=A0A919WF05_9BACI|nr:stage III sporulation protein AF [Robertmurraya siralis]PAE22133.1 stage III sporulation protein AF [Bacillus sp. 7504-2]GIN60582.1 stage III sporulation protein AF [Robertmurraya siralis]
MDYITEWITNIILFVLIATVIDLLLPNTSLQKYTKMVAGLLLITIILSPIFKLLSSDFESALASIPSIQSNSEEKNMENLIELQKKEIQASNHAYILEETAVQLQSDVEKELMDQYGLEIAHIEIDVDDDSQSESFEQIQSIVVQLKEPNTETDAVEVVKKVEINTSEPLPSKKLTKESQAIASLLSEKWDVEKEKIEIVVEGGSD